MLDFSLYLSISLSQSIEYSDRFTLFYVSLSLFSSISNDDDDDDGSLFVCVLVLEYSLYSKCWISLSIYLSIYLKSLQNKKYL